MDRSSPRKYKYEPLGDITRNFRVLELKPWGVSVPAADFTFFPPNLAPAMPSLRDDSRRPLGNDDLRVGRPMIRATAKAPLDGKLFTQDIDRFTKYEALSWCWPDNEERDRGISLLNANGQRTGLSISTILYVALKTLRYEDKSRFLWIDQICINQADSVERKQQLQIMTKIYQAAEHVCVYLGPERDESNLVPHFIRTLDNYLDRPTTSPGKVRRWNAFCALMRRKWFTRRWVVQEIAFAKKATLYFGPRSSIDWNLFRNAVWLTIQREDDVVRLLIEHRKGMTSPPRWDLINIRAYGAQSLLEVLGHLVQKHPNGGLRRLATIGTLVSALVAYDVTDSRDAIYAVLRLGRDTFNGNPELLKPDYKSEPVKPKKPVDPNKPVERDNWMYTTYTFEVYGKFIRYVIRESASLDIICVPWAPELNKHDRDEENMPSWIGSREKRPFKQLAGDGMYKRVNADCLIGKLEGSVYCATGQEQLLFCQPNLDSKPRSLVVDGFQISGISELGDICEKGEIPFEWLHMAWEHDEALGPTQEVKDIWPPDGLPTLTHPSPAWQVRDGRGRDSHGLPHISDAFWRTLVGNRDPKGRPAPAWYQKLCKTHFRGRFGNHRGRRGKVFTDEVRQLAVMRGKKDDREFIDRLQAVTWNRRFMFTYDGRMGIVPGEAKHDDRICLLWGCNVPVVLRPLTRTIEENFYKESVENNVRSGVDVYRLIGACYVHGVMDGELVKDYPELRKPHRWQEEFPNTKMGFGPVGNTRFRII